MSTRSRLLLVHGSVVNAAATWRAQRPLAERFDLVAPNRRGFPPGPDVERVDFEDEAMWLEQFLEPGTHVAGHSYGGLIAMLASARRPDAVRSLTVIEPPAFGIARGLDGVDAFDARLGELWLEGPHEPEPFLREFLRRIGASVPSGRFTPEFLQGARTLMVERSPAEAEIRLEALAAAPFPLLAVSGGHEPAFETVCDVLAERAGAERAILPGAGHSVQRLGAPFNELLAAFVERAEAATQED
ncbi:MAG TPA: alpha/beta fold hydrolase [Gaiellaceae bacterium]|nr:alpha/beta fold hydrolase [Gaiellaceae bacterium]